jgi:hypothetical protein
MEWETVGADCATSYDSETKKELAKRTKEQEKQAEKERKEYKKKQELSELDFNKLVSGVTIELKDEKGWNKVVKINSDPYGKATVEYAEGWAKLMQIEIAKGKTVIQCAEKTQENLDFMGITGFMYGCAVQMLSQYWKHGEELRKWHNKEYGHEGEGVVNPAVFTVGK